MARPTGLAQYNLTRTYSVEDGLPATEVHQVFAASDGTIYFITTLGHRLRYDGFRFEWLSSGQPPTNTGKLSSQIFEDRSGIWMLHGSEAFLYRNGREQRVKLPTVLTAFADRQSRELVLIDNSFQWLTFNEEQSAFAPSKIFDHTGLPGSDSTMSYHIISHRNTYWVKAVGRDYRNNQLYQTDLREPAKNEKWVTSRVWTMEVMHPDTLLLSIFPPGEDLAGIPVIWQNGQTTIVQGKGWGYEDRQFTGYRPFTQRGRFFLYGYVPTSVAGAEKEWEIWEVNTRGQAKLLVRIDLRGAITGFIPQLDAAGNFWIPTHAGLTKIFPAFLGFFDDQPQMISGLHAINEDHDGNIWLGSYQEGFSRFDGNRLQRVSVPERYQYVHPGSWRDASGLMYFFSTRTQGFFTSDGQDWQGIPWASDPKDRLLGFVFHPLQAGQQLALGLAYQKGIGIMEAPFEPGKPLTFIDHRQGMQLINVLTIVEDPGQRIWFGRHSQGVGVYDPGLDTAVTWVRSRETDIGAISSTIDSYGNLWLGTNHGLAFLSQPESFDFLGLNINDSIRVLQLAQAGNSLVTFLTEHHPYLIFGNMEGFGLLDLSSYYQNPDQPIVHFFSTSAYLQGGGSEQNAVWVDRAGYVWMGNDRGAIRMDWRQLSLDTSRIHLDSLFFIHGKDERSIPSEQSLRIPRGQRHLDLHWSAILDQQLTPNRWLTYTLVLDGGDTLHHQTFVQERALDLGYIPPGRHRLSVRLFKNNQLQEQRELQVIIPPNLENTWWFWALISAFTILATAMVFGLIYRNKRQQQRHELATARLRQEKKELQIQAITSSLNPHFLNNTLHWVQARARRDEVASEVIDKLAANIRTIFQQSREKLPFHSLKNELSLVDNYLMIQKERFGERYKFIMPGPAERQHYGDLLVPLMQIQIHVENAIEHGLRHRKESRTARVSIQERDEYIDLMVEDDGIGYGNAGQKVIHHTQQGTQMLNNLHKIFNAKNQYKISTKIEDNLYIDPASKKAYGTRITVSIPKAYHYAY